MKFSHKGRLIATSIFSMSAMLAITSCGTDSTAGFLFVPLASINQQGGGGVNVFRIEHDFGKLSLLSPSPVSSGGNNAVRSVLAGAGRFLYVINQGVETSQTSAVELFSIGGNGVLTPQQGYATQGTSPVDAAIDGSGSHLYVLDEFAPPGAQCPGNDPTKVQPPNPTAATSCLGDITAFSIDATTGRLTLIQNQNLTNANGTQLTYFPVGLNPIRLLIPGNAGIAFTLDQGDSTVFPYQVNSNGQLTLTQNGPINIGSGLFLTAIGSDGGSHIYITDAANNQIFPFTIGPGGSLALVNPGAVPNQPGTAFPDAVLVVGKFLYIGNRGANPNNQNPNSSISAFTVDPTTSKLQIVPNSPFAVDSGVNCLVEDPSGQYIYASAFDDSTIRGSLLRSDGELQNLLKGTSFATGGTPSCLIASGRTS